VSLNIRRLTLGGCAALLLWGVGVAGQARDAATVLAATRQALGGDANLAAVKTFVATGRTRQLRGNNLVPIEFEIVAELPTNTFAAMSFRRRTRTLRSTASAPAT